jgi:hypothetical protein
MFRPCIPFVSALIGLAACGGGGGGGGGDDDDQATRALAPLVVTEGVPQTMQSRDFTATYDPGRDEITLSTPFGGVQQVRVLTTLTRNQSPTLTLPQGFAAYQAPAEAQAVRGTTASGSGSVLAARWEGFGMVREHARLSETTLPTAGGATYFGTYAGVLGDADNLYENAGLIRGNVTLNADFDAAVISGRIADRINSSGRNFDALELPGSTIEAADGSFGGETRGGLASDLAYTGAAGRFSGLIVGADGGEVVGGVTVEHSKAGAPTILELGGFVASESVTP